MTVGIARAERGQALVEMALTLPVLLVLVIGSIDVGLAVNAYVTVTNASREGALYAAQHPDASPAAIVAVAKARTAPLPTVAVAVTYCASGCAGASPSFTAWPSAGLSSSSPAAAVPVRVDVAYDWSAHTILIGDLVRGVTFHGISTKLATW